MTDSIYKPGEKPPTGYLEWHDWAEVQRKAGIKQKPCPKCGKWLTPQEVEDHAAEHFKNGIKHADAIATLKANDKVRGAKERSS